MQETKTLDAWLTERGMTEQAFGLEIGVSQAAVHRYRTGKRLPKPEVMARIRQATAGEVGPHSFYEVPSSISGGMAAA